MPFRDIVRVALIQLVANVIAATAEGYPFPTNLDRDTPVDGMTPGSRATPSEDAVMSVARR